MIDRNMTCTKYYNDKCDMYYYVKFWNTRYFPNDCYRSPLYYYNKKLNKENDPLKKKYVLFEPDQGGWNNIRMAAETAIVFALITGRTLVLPPAMKFYLLDKNKNENDNSTFEKFFDLDKLKEFIDIISMEEFLIDVASKPNALKKQFNYTTDEELEKFLSNKTKLWEYLFNSCYIENWETDKRFLGFNIKSGYKEERHYMRGTKNPNKEIVPIFGNFDLSDNNYRIREMSLSRRKLRPYNESLDKNLVIYFSGDYDVKYRLLIHFYAYLYLEDRHLEQFYKRLVRDRLHYQDDIFCNAGNLIRAIHDDAGKINNMHSPTRWEKLANEYIQKTRSEPGEMSLPVLDIYQYKMDPNKNKNPFLNDLSNPYPKYLKTKLSIKMDLPPNIEVTSGGGNINFDATYHALHIRRGDFQYKQTRLNSEELYNNIKHLLDPRISKLLYIATDEKNKEFFKPFFDDGRYEVRFLSDYEKYFNSDFNYNYIGMVEQVICANAHTFVGTPLSTFTGYITRMRGYHKDGRIHRTFYTIPSFMFQMQLHHKLSYPLWAREFSASYTMADDFFTEDERNTSIANIEAEETELLEIN